MAHAILIVDDSPAVRKDLAEAFEAAGFRALSCATLLEGRAVLNTAKIGVALLAGQLGRELLLELRASKSNSGAAVLLFGAPTEGSERLRSSEPGGDRDGGKPYDAGTLVARVQELLGTRAAASTPCTILVIDARATFCETLSARLRDAGYNVLVASTGEEGLRIATVERPSAILVNASLSGMDGATLIRRVRLDAGLRAAACLLLSGSEDHDAELRALDAGAEAFVRVDEQPDAILTRVAAVLQSGTAAAPDVAGFPRGGRVLAVDDSASYLRILAQALRTSGYDVTLAHTGEQALELLAARPVDCVLLDLTMPGIGGEETCRRIKAAPVVRDTPIIILTSVDDRQAILDALAAGADDCIAKSDELEVLEARVRAQIRRKQLEQETRRVREQLLRSEREASEARAAHELAETRAALIEELERKNRALEAFSYSVSHDLRAPLRSIDGFSQALMEDHLEQLDAKAQSYLVRVRAAAQRMAELIDDLLELSRVSRSELRRERVDLSLLAREVASELQRRTPQRRAEVVIGAGLVVSADARLLKIVLENLLENAWKFTSQVAVAEIEVGQTGSGDDAVYFVRDNGAGFSMAYADKLFRPFQRLHSEQEFPGTGIGLATIQRVIERHGGRAWADGEVGRGATFFFTLPEKPGARR
jgi:DNA-binding response OmpR family regulator